MLTHTKNALIVLTHESPVSELERILARLLEGLEYSVALYNTLSNFKGGQVDTRDATSLLFGHTFFLSKLRIVYCLSSKMVIFPTTHHQPLMISNFICNLLVKQNTVARYEVMLGVTKSCLPNFLIRSSSM